MKGLQGSDKLKYLSQAADTHRVLGEINPWKNQREVDISTQTSEILLNPSYQKPYADLRTTEDALDFLGQVFDQGSLELARQEYGEMLSQEESSQMRYFGHIALTWAVRPSALVYAMVSGQIAAQTQVE